MVRNLEVNRIMLNAPWTAPSDRCPLEPAGAALPGRPGASPRAGRRPIASATLVHPMSLSTRTGLETVNGKKSRARDQLASRFGRNTAPDEGRCRRRAIGRRGAAPGGIRLPLPAGLADTGQ